MLAPVRGDPGRSRAAFGWGRCNRRRIAGVEMSSSGSRAVTPARSPFADEIREIHAALSELRTGRSPTTSPSSARPIPTGSASASSPSTAPSTTSATSHQPFTIQSISKPFVYGLALEDHGRDAVLARVGVEPTGDAFNSIMRRRRHRGGRSTRWSTPARSSTAGLVAGDDADVRLDRVLRDASRRFAGRDLEIDEEVFASERATGHRNRAIAYLMRDFGIVDDVDEVLDLYFRQCSLLVDCSRPGRDGRDARQRRGQPGHRRARHRARSTSRTCSASWPPAACTTSPGEWLYRVGLPAKSGVGGRRDRGRSRASSASASSRRGSTRGATACAGIAVCQELSRRFALHQYRPGLLSTDAIGRRLRGGVMRSRRSRARAESQVLDREGARIGVYELHGDLVFGSAERLVREVGAELEELEWVILDFRRVTAVDDVSWRLIGAFAEQAAERGDPRDRHLRGAPAAGASRRRPTPTRPSSAARTSCSCAASASGRGRSVPLEAQPLLQGLGPPEAVPGDARRDHDGHVRAPARWCSATATSRTRSTSSRRARCGPRWRSTGGSRTVRLQTMGPGVALRRDGPARPGPPLGVGDRGGGVGRPRAAVRGPPPRGGRAPGRHRGLLPQPRSAASPAGCGAPPGRSRRWTAEHARSRASAGNRSAARPCPAAGPGACSGSGSPATGWRSRAWPSSG